MPSNRKRSKSRNYTKKGRKTSSRSRRRSTSRKASSSRRRSRGTKKSRSRKSKRKSTSRRRSRKSRSTPYKSRSRRSRSRKGVAKGCGELSSGACNDKFTNGLRACRWSYSKLKCQSIPKKYRHRATLGVGGDATYKKYKAGERRKLSPRLLNRRSPGKLEKGRLAMFNTEKKAIRAQRDYPDSSDIIISEDAPNAPAMFGFYY